MHNDTTFVCLMGNLFLIPEKSNSFLMWLQSLAAYLRNTCKVAGVFSQGRIRMRRLGAAQDVRLSGS